MELTKYNYNTVYHSKRTDYGLLMAKLQTMKSKYRLNRKELDSMVQIILHNI